MITTVANVSTDEKEVPRPLKDYLTQSGKHWVLKWFAGKDMYNTLRLAARRGFEDIRSLLDAARTSTSLVLRSKN